MTAAAARNTGSGALTRAGHLAVLVLPVGIWALSYVPQPTFHRFYREVFPMFYPSFAVMWVFAAVELFWPNRMPPAIPKSRDRVVTEVAETDPNW